MHARLAAVLTTAAVGLSLVAPSGPASASTGGTVDANNTYSGVGMIAFYDEGSRYRCSATLVSPTVLLTAAHCTFGVDGKTAVTFKLLVDDAAPSNLPVAKDPAAGYTSADLVGTGYLSGTAYTHPDYSDFTDVDNWNDVGVIVLDAPVSNVAITPIAEEGTLDTIARRDLRTTIFRAVGYGTEVRQATSGPRKPTPQSYPIVRRYVDMPGQKLTSQILQTNGNENDNAGTGGTCFGDSGGPLLLDGEIVGVTSYGYTSNCRYIDGYQRVEIDVVQDWLATFGL
ncbi:trypsin-like serine protease [Nocardioides sp. S-58]|uniref:Trypsin-like serine protease n=1 Tax=Nocardioides renjunii TaxID=3095075 RepID=A0ABU5KDD5_9ACTN|nr:trypsin-like serine protease [Nocardioides sp. S-58]MDZ5662842.1 trypsin-like serine protease [Nocardioides sp. S-58]